MPDEMWWQGPCVCRLCGYRWQLVAQLVTDQERQEQKPAMVNDCPSCGSGATLIREDIANA